MGITGLIPFLEKASSTVNIKSFKGSSVAVDSYCWLHKGVFACAEKLIRGETTDIHIQYCLKYVDMLRRHDISIIMVFDGRHLPAKAETERRRREARKESKQLAKEYLRRNEIEKARSHMRRAVDVTHEMALDLIKACRNRGIDCIVAPYEADAQMAWLNQNGLAEYIVTEDSDLTLFGAQKILFKLDLTGQALLVESTKLYLAMGCKPEKYTFDKFLRMCILSGCDYLDSLHGIGLKKACKFILTTEEDDMTKALKKIPSYLKMKQLEVPTEYIESFLKAEATFKHMFIYNPLERRMERLNELDKFHTDECYCSNAGSLLDSSEQAFELALGNLNPFTLKQLDFWHPNQNWYNHKSKHKSIWINLKDDHIGEESSKCKQISKKESSILHFKKIEYKNMAEVEIAEKLSEERSKLEESEIFSMYKYASPKMERKRKRHHSSSCDDEESEKIENLDENHQKCTHNPFAKVNNSLENIHKSPVCANISLLKLLSPKKSIEENVQQQTMASKKSVKSRFFAENVKQLNKPFAARDLTSEMFTIEKKANTYTEQQQDLYYCSLPSIKKEQRRFDNQITDKDKKSNESTKKSLESPVSDTIESTDSSQESKTSGSSDIKDEIILLSDIEDQQYSQKSSKVNVSNTKNKSQNFSRKLSNTSGKIDAKQSKLSMFGFKKRPSLKKL